MIRWKCFNFGIQVEYGNLMVAGVSLHPSAILGSSLRQDLRSDRILTMHVAEKLHNMFGTGQQRQVSLNHDAVETVI